MAKRSSLLNYDPSNLSRPEIEQVIYNIERAPYIGTEYNYGIVDRDPARAAEVLALMESLLAAKVA